MLRHQVLHPPDVLLDLPRPVSRLAPVPAQGRLGRGKLAGAGLQHGGQKDLDELRLRQPPEVLEGAAEGVEAAGEFRGVDGLDDVEEFAGLAALIGLEVTDQVEAGAGKRAGPRGLGEKQRRALMNAMLQVANGVLWAAAIIASALMRAPWFLTVVLLPCLGVTAVLLAYASQRSLRAEQRGTPGHQAGPST